MQDKTLYTQLAEQIGAGESKVVSRLFETLLDESEAKLVLAAAPPATAEELAQRTGIDTARIGTMIDGLFRKGLLFKSKKPDGIRYYRVRHVLQFHDATAVMHDPPPKMLDLWKEYTRTEWEEQSKVYEALLPQAAMRVVPINVSLEPNSQILASDDVSKLIDGARNIAVTKCSCRVIDGACGKPVEVCMQLDRAADYSIERGTGRKLSREEALRMLERCEEEGLVHVAENKQGVGNVICNCCRDCCINWPSVRTGLGKFVSPSRFRAVVDGDECNGCELCIDRCFFDAMKMVDGDTLAAVDEEKCMGCGVCRVACVVDAISMQVVRPQEFVPA
jgi:Pyruvate/2-oxoacid:ferredoxin oxidoreductase delta subunit/DNA-binding MarR family transcriptional regulator